MPHTHLGIGSLAYLLAPVNHDGIFLDPDRPHPATFTFAIFLGASMCMLLEMTKDVADPKMLVTLAAEVMIGFL